jgi:hypothetical protein
MCVVQLQAQSAIEAEAAGRTPRGAITPRPSMMRFREDQTDTRSGAATGGGIPVGDSPNNTKQTLLSAAEDEPRLCSSAPTSPTRASAPAALPTRGAPQRTPLKGKQAARATILNPTRRRAIFAYLCAVQRSLLLQFPKPAVELLVEYLSQVFFLESFVTPAPKECLVARNKCSVVLGCFKQSALPASQRPGPDSDEGEADSIRTPTAGGEPGAVNVRPAAVYITPVLPGDLATEFHFTITVRRTQHFAMECGVVHQSFLPTGASASGGSTGGVSGGFGSSQALKRAASTVGKPLDLSKGVRVSALSSARIPPVGIELPSREPLTLETSTLQSNAVEVDHATESVMYLSIYWDGLSRTATFSATDLKPVELGKRGQTITSMPRATPVSTGSSRNIFAPPPSQNSLAGASAMPSPGSLPNSQRIFGVPGLLSSSIRSNSGLLFESPAVGAPGVECAPVQLQLPPAVSGRWSLVLSCESAADVRIQML